MDSVLIFRCGYCCSCKKKCKGHIQTQQKKKKNNFVETRKLRESNDVSMVLISGQLSGSSADSGGRYEEQRLSYFFYIYMTTRLAQPEAYSRNHQRRCLPCCKSSQQLGHSKRIFWCLIFHGS